MQAPGPELPSPGVPGSPLRGSFFGGSFFTTPPEEVGDISTENKRRKSWWGGERVPSLSRKSSVVDKKLEKERQRSDKEKSMDEPSKQRKAKSGGDTPDGKEGTECVEVKVQAKGEEIKAETKWDTAHYPGSGKLEKEAIKVEVVGEVVMGNGSFPVGEDNIGEARTIEKQLKPETMKAGSGEKSLREAKSLCSLDSEKSSKDSAKSLKKPWSLMIARRPTLERIPILSKKFTGDVAGPRFGTVNGPEAGRCAGDHPPIYQDGFVSPISSPYLYLP